MGYKLSIFVLAICLFLFFGVCVAGILIAIYIPIIIVGICFVLFCFVLFFLNTYGYDYKLDIFDLAIYINKVTITDKLLIILSFVFL